MYDISSASAIQFSVTCVFESTKRWERVGTPPPGTFLAVTAKIAGRTTDTNRLLLGSLSSLTCQDLSRPRPYQYQPLVRFERIKSLGVSRGLSTPSKRQRISDFTNEPANPPDRDSTASYMDQTRCELHRLTQSTESTSVPASPPLTAAHHDDSTLGSDRPLTSDTGPRLHRNRHLPKRYADLEPTAANPMES